MAASLVAHGGCRSVAVVAGDTPGSAPLPEFLARADSACTSSSAASSSGSSGGSCAPGSPAPPPPSPVIPHLYDRVARWQMRRHGVTREQLVGDGGGRWGGGAVGGTCAFEPTGACLV
jgi:hypothetical protein